MIFAKVMVFHQEGKQPKMGWRRRGPLTGAWRVCILTMTSLVCILTIKLVVNIHKRLELIDRKTPLEVVHALDTVRSQCGCEPTC